MKKIFHIGVPVFLLLSLNDVKAQQTAAPAANTDQLQSFPLKDIRLLPGFFNDAQQTDLKYILSLDADKLLVPFLREAGIATSKSSYGNWENTGLDGHTAGHYLSALANMYAATGNSEILKRLHYMLDQLDSCQRKNGNGYIGGVPGGKAIWAEIAAGNIKANSFSLNGKWVPLYNIHKLYAGLIDSWLIAGIPQARDMVVKYAYWCLELTRNLTDEQIQDMLRSEHGGLNEVFAQVASITGNKQFLNLAYRFSHRRILNPLLQGKDSLNGLHANTQIPKIVGFERIAEVAGDNAMHKAADFFWQTVVHNRSVSVGGNSVSEHFNPANNFSSMMQSREGIETCNSYNMLRLTKSLFLQKPEVGYIDYYERTTYNHILSSQHPHGGFVYFTPMRPNHYRVYSEPQKDFWCCVGTGLENHGKYGELIYAHRNKDLFVNLFIPSQLNWAAQGITIRQQTKFPFEEKTSIQLVKVAKPAGFTVYIRVPHWVNKGEFRLLVNNKPVSTESTPGSYAAVRRTWKTGDVITIETPMHTMSEKLPDGSDWVSFVHGPVVLAAATDTSGMTGERGDGSRMGHVARGPLFPIDEAPLVVTSQTDPAAEVQKINQATLSFQVPRALYPARFSTLKLVPFFTIRDSRYMLYWPLTTPEALEQKQKEIKEREKEILALEKITVDQVSAGEQQPETDHQFTGQDTESGLWSDRHFRKAKGWFSYILRDPSKQASHVRVTYSGLDAGNNFDIFINDVLVKTEILEAKGNSLYDLVYDIPENAKNTTLTIRFAARKASVAGSVYHVRVTR